MATYTPNLNLGKPEATDPFGNFRQLFNDNMDILDNGGGGGSGGHTIVNPSGTDMPAEGKLQFTGGVTVTDDSVNGKTVVDISGGGGNVYGAFIDTNRVITSGTYSGAFSYTATEDCAFRFVVSGTSSSSGKVFLDGVIIQSIYVPNNNDYQDIVFIKKGQTVRVESQQGGTWNYTVYGLTQGTNGIFTPIIYSDTERVVGVWRDNKPLYAKTVGIGTLPNNATKLTAHGISDIDTICSIDGIAYDGSGKTLSLGYINVDSYTYDVQVEVGKVNVEIKTKIDFTSYTGYITVQYTKTTDVAGSGAWNTDGVPTVHYSTSEQVIGTWENGKPLYQQTVIFDTGNVASNIDFNISSYMPVNSVVRHSSFTLDFTFNGDTYHGANWGGAYVEINGVSYLSFSIGSAVYNKHVELTIQYTKTTD